MQSVESPLALDLAREVRSAVAPDEFVNEALKREQGLKELHAFLEKQKREAAQKAVREAAREMEKMLIAAIQNGVALSIIEIMRQNSRITDSRLAELREQANIV